MSFEDYLASLERGASLSKAQAAKFLGLLLDGTNVGDEQIIATLTVLARKKVTVDEVCGFVDSMRSRMIHIACPEGAIDTCGTGGDKSGTFNISTASAILLAAGGVTVAKHGNRAATSKCGSYDVLRALGVPVELEAARASQELEHNNFVFLFAPIYHPELKRLAIIRKQLSFPTIFNILGPLLNPASVKRQVIGTYSLANAKLLSEVVATMNHEHTIVLTCEDGLDEASLSSATHIFEIKGTSITEAVLRPSDFGLLSAPNSAMLGGGAEVNASLLTRLFVPAGELGPHQRVVILNAGLGFYVSGQSSSIYDGVDLAMKTLQSGDGSFKLQELCSPGMTLL